MSAAPTMPDRIQWTGENIASVSWFLQADVFRGALNGLLTKGWGTGEELVAAQGDWFVRQWDGSHIVEDSDGNPR